MGPGEEQGIVGLLAEAVESRTPVVLATVVATSRSVPRRPGAKMLVYGDGTQVGTIGGGAMESRVLQAVAEALESGRASTLQYELVDPGRGDPGVCGGTVEIFVEPFMPAHTVLVIGAGHVGRAVVDLAAWLGYYTVVTDDRPDLVTEEAMPNAAVRHNGSVEEALESHEVSEDTSVVLVSRDIGIDMEAIPLLLDTPASYIGVMGSERRWLTVRKGLTEAGVGEDQLDRVHVPVGVEINAETVEEIAVSILAELIGNNRGAGG